MMQLAVRYGAISVNPVREVESIEHPAKKPARAIPTDEVTQLRTHLRADATAVRADLPDVDRPMAASLLQTYNLTPEATKPC